MLFNINATVSQLWQKPTKDKTIKTKAAVLLHRDRLVTGAKALVAPGDEENSEEETLRENDPEESPRQWYCES